MSLFLNRIRLHDFRGFAELEVELPEGPGVFIVHGTNGLGKSSLFDALEWALTDRIDHFSKIAKKKLPGTYLTRWGKPREPRSTSVALTFSDNSLIERSLPSKRARKSVLGGTIEHIADHLRDPNWKRAISSLDHHLLLTHFLGQSTISRLTHREPRDRFDILREAAQSNEIQTISDTLHGTGVSVMGNAFNRQANFVRKDVTILTDLLAQEIILFNESQKMGALTPDDVATERRAIAGLLIDIAPSAIGRQIGSPAMAFEQPDQLIARIGEAGREIARRAVRARQLLTERGRIETESIANAAGVREAQAQRDQLNLARSEAETERAARAAAVAQQRLIVDDKTRRSMRLFALQASRAALTKTETALNEADQKLNQLNAERAKLDHGDRRDRRAMDIVSRLTDEADALDSELAAICDALPALDELAANAARLTELREAIAAIAQGHPNLADALPRARAEALAAEETARNQAAALSALTASTDALSTALAAVIAHVNPASCACPLCATTFPSADALRAQIDAAADRLSPALLAQERTAQTSAEHSREAKAHLDGLVAHERQRTELMVQEGAARDHQAALIKRLSGLALDQALSIDDRKQQVVARANRLASRIKRRRNWARHRWLGGGQLRRQADTRRRERDRVQRALDAARTTLIDLQAQLERRNADVENALGQVVAGGDPTTADMATLLEAAMAETNAATTSFRQLETDLTAFETRLAQLDTDIAVRTARVTELAERETVLGQQLEANLTDWAELQIFGPLPDLNQIRMAEEKTASDGKQLAEAEARLSRLRMAEMGWDRRQQHRQLLEDLRALLDMAPNSSRDKLRQGGETRSRELTERLERIERARQIAWASSRAIEVKLSQFDTDYIRPLGELMDRINAAILCDPRIGIALEVKARRVIQSARKTGEMPTDLHKVDPSLVHSEGQMAALAVSLLCAASLTFPWSRWRALILDDPLQHNDAIHAAAFADLMSNLVRDRDYQILMSSHDLAQVEFLQRKFRANQVACTTLRLEGQGRGGVTWSQSPVTRPREDKLAVVA
ncbi:AAA family ATPase [Sphingomonas sp. NPDC079357]|uniref:AAA family ATPase n=1 Tax=Sphingomonas sp. NPDC079357 TaxID=3364518 RepID=UPI00384ABF13